MTHIHSKAKQLLLSASEARSIFSYNPDTGELRRSVGQCAGSLAGGLTTRGYRHAYVRGTYFAVHRLCWLVHFGRWPDGDIDHINGDRLDNRICNLRSVTVFENNMNRRGAAPARNYGFDRRKGKWRVYLRRQRSYKHLGYFSTEAEASAFAATF